MRYLLLGVTTSGLLLSAAAAGAATATAMSRVREKTRVIAGVPRGDESEVSVAATRQESKGPGASSTQEGLQGRAQGRRCVGSLSPCGRGCREALRAAGEG